MVLAVDRIALGDGGLWQALSERIDPHHRFERGIVRDRLELRRIGGVEPHRQRVFVVGSSRAVAGFRPRLVAESLPEEAAFGLIAHGGFTTFEMRSMVADMLAAEPDAVVFVLSELEINTPLRILAQSSFSSLPAIGDLVAAVGPRFAFANRQILYRLAAANLLNAYRYRQVLDRAFAGRWRRFAASDRLTQGRAPRTPMMILSADARKTLGRRSRQRLLATAKASFPDTPERIVEESFRRVVRIARGDHATIQQDFVRRSIGRLAAAGARVVIVEAPLHPLAERLYDVAARDDFLTFAADLERDFGARLMPLEAIGAFTGEDFTDLIHLGESGGIRLTRQIVGTVGEILEISQPKAE